MSMNVSAGFGPKNEFEKVDSVQPDALTLELFEKDGAPHGAVHCPAGATGGRLPKDYHSDPMPAKEAFRSAIKLANDMKAPVVVLDPADLWPKEWGQLFIIDDEAGA
jgi:hypothetical protein